jgi:hypothetical protein
VCVILAIVVLVGIGSLLQSAILGACPGIRDGGSIGISAANL